MYLPLHITVQIYHEIQNVGIFWVKLQKQFFRALCLILCHITLRVEVCFCKIKKKYIFPRSQPALGCQPVFERGTLMLVDPFFHYSCVFFCTFSSFSFSDGKRCLNVEKDHFKQQTTCEALVCWSKYTTMHAALVPKNKGSSWKILSPN